MPVDLSFLNGLDRLPTVPSAATAVASLDQSEAIGHRELSDLVGRLTKRKSDKHQQIGRAIAKALRGEAFCAAAPGRNSFLFQIAGEIIEAYPYADVTGVARAFEMSLGRLAETSAAAGIPPSNPSPTVAEFVSMMQRHQGPKQQKHATGAALEKSYQTALDLLPRITEAEAAVWDLPPEAVDAVPDDLSAAGAGLDYRSIIVRVDDGCYFLRHPQARTYQIQCNGKEALRMQLQRLVLDMGGLGMIITDDTGDMVETDKILRAYGTAARSIVYDYAATETEFDPATGALRRGFSMGTMPDATTVDPEISERVETWLRHLAGGTEDALEELYDWIASTDQRYIRTNAAAIVIIGPPGVGKTVFARALARTWGQTEPVSFGAVVDRFNGILTRCPIWFADEKVPDDLDDAHFREIVQCEQRDVEFKGQERMILKGTSRILIGLNQIADLRIRSSTGPDGARAVADRLAIYHTSREKTILPLLLKIHGDDRLAQVAEIARHLRWVQANVVPRGQRFLGARRDTTGALTPILEASAQVSPMIFDALREYFLDPLAWEKEYAPSDQLSMPGRRYSIICGLDRSSRSPMVYVNVPEVCKRYGVPERDRKTVTAALRPFQIGDETRWQNIGGKTRFRARYTLLDAERLDAVLGVDMIPALVPGTRVRLNLDLDTED